MDDWELVYMYQQNSDLVLKMAINKYREMINIMINRFSIDYKITMKKDDLFQIAIIQLDECFNIVRYDKMANFSTFYQKILRNAIVDYERKCSSNRKRYIYLDFDDDDSYSINDVNKAYHVKMESQKSVHDVTMNHICYDLITSKLSDDDLRILKLKQKGYKHYEIAKLINKSLSHVNHTLRRIKNTIRNCEIKIDE